MTSSARGCANRSRTINGSSNGWPSRCPGATSTSPDFLLVAEVVLDIPAEDLAHAARIDLAESALHAPAAEFGGVEFYTDLATKTAVLASRIIRNHPLTDGNKRVGYLCALEFVARNGGTWTQPLDDPEGDETVAIIEGLAAGEVDEDELKDWIADRLE